MPFLRSDLDPWWSDHSRFKSYFSNYKSDLDHWRSDYNQQIKTVSIFFIAINEKSKMAATDKKESFFRYIITNNEHKNIKSMSFVVSSPWERSE